MSRWMEQEIKYLIKLVKKRKTAKQISKKFEKKGYQKNIFEILTKIRSLPELRPYLQQRDWSMEDLEKFVDVLKKQKKPREL